MYTQEGVDKRYCIKNTQAAAPKSSKTRKLTRRGAGNKWRRSLDPNVWNGNIICSQYLVDTLVTLPHALLTLSIVCQLKGVDVRSCFGELKRRVYEQRWVAAAVILISKNPLPATRAQLEIPSANQWKWCRTPNELFCQRCCVQIFLFRFDLFWFCSMKHHSPLSNNERSQVLYCNNCNIMSRLSGVT